MEKINLMVCPHDTARNPERWVLFAQYLGKLSDKIISFQSSIDFKEFHENMASSDLIYANPQDSLSLCHDHGYIPLVRPEGLYDEVVFIANKNLKEKSLASFNNEKVASVTSMMPTSLAIKYLQDQGISPSSVKYCDSWVAVVREVSTGKSPFGFIYQDFYNGLNNLSKSMVDFVESTLTKELYHMVLLHPKHKAIADEMKNIFLEMHTGPLSVSVMQELKISRFESVDAEAMEAIKALRSIKLSNEGGASPELEELACERESA